MVHVPLHLWNRPHWELRGKPDAASFFRHLNGGFPTATTMFVEGTNISPDVEEFYRTAAQDGDYLPAGQTIWPKAAQYRLACDASTMTALAALAERHAEPELCDHLFVYAGAEPLLEYPDAFGRNCPAYVSMEADEPTIRSFAASQGLELIRADDDR